MKKSTKHMLAMALALTLLVSVIPAIPRLASAEIQTICGAGPYAENPDEVEEPVRQTDTTKNPVQHNPGWVAGNSNSGFTYYKDSNVTYTRPFATLTKTAEYVGNDNKFEITLSVKGDKIDPPPAPVYTVLVLDLSGSMAWNLAGSNPSSGQSSRLDLLKTSVNEFVNSYFPTGDEANSRNYLSIVTYNNSWNEFVSWTNKKSSVTSKLSSYPTLVNNTNVQAGIIGAVKMLNKISTDNTIKPSGYDLSECHYNVVVMTDGGANVSSNASNLDTWDNIIKNGANSSTSTSSATTSNHINHSNRAINAASILKNGHSKIKPYVYSIMFGTFSNTDSASGLSYNAIKHTMYQISSAIPAGTAQTNLTAINQSSDPGVDASYLHFATSEHVAANILSKIDDASSHSTIDMGATIRDVIPKDFTIISAKGTIIHHGTSDITEYEVSIDNLDVDENGNPIVKWTITIPQGLGSNYEARLVITVEVPPTCLVHTGTEGDADDDHVLVPSNEGATLEYSNILNKNSDGSNGDQWIVEFPIPEVHVPLTTKPLDIEKTVVDGAVNTAGENEDPVYTINNNGTVVYGIRISNPNNYDINVRFSDYVTVFGENTPIDFEDYDFYDDPQCGEDDKISLNPDRILIPAYGDYTFYYKLKHSVSTAGINAADSITVTNTGRIVWTEGVIEDEGAGGGYQPLDPPTVEDEAEGTYPSTDDDAKVSVDLTGPSLSVKKQVWVADSDHENDGYWSDDPAQVPINGYTWFKIEITNNGDTDADKVKLKDVFDTIELDESDFNGAVVSLESGETPSDDTLVKLLAGTFTLPEGETVIITYYCNALTEHGYYINTAYVYKNYNDDTDEPADSDNALVQVGEDSDKYTELYIDKSVWYEDKEQDNDEWREEIDITVNDEEPGTATFQIVVKNRTDRDRILTFNDSLYGQLSSGDDLSLSIDSAVITDALGNEKDYAYTSASDIFNAEIRLAQGKTLTIEYTITGFTAQEPGVKQLFTNKVTVSYEPEEDEDGYEVGPIEEEDSATVNAYEPTDAILSVTKKIINSDADEDGKSAKLQIGDSAIFEITIKNTGDADATSVRLEDWFGMEELDSEDLSITSDADDDYSGGISDLLNGTFTIYAGGTVTLSYPSPPLDRTGWYVNVVNIYNDGELEDSDYAKAHVVDSDDSYKTMHVEKLVSSNVTGDWVDDPVEIMDGETAKFQIEIYNRSVYEEIILISDNLYGNSDTNMSGLVTTVSDTTSSGALFLYDDGAVEHNIFGDPIRLSSGGWIKITYQVEDLSTSDSVGSKSYTNVVTVKYESFTEYEREPGPGDVPDEDSNSEEDSAIVVVNPKIPKIGNISVTKILNGVSDSTYANPVEIEAGETMLFDIIIENISDVRIDITSITDNKIKNQDLYFGGSALTYVLPKSLEPGDKMIVSGELSAPAAGKRHSNTVTVIGKYDDEAGNSNAPVTGSDSAYAKSADAPEPTPTPTPTPRPPITEPDPTPTPTPSRSPSTSTEDDTDTDTDTDTDDQDDQDNNDDLTEDEDITDETVDTITPVEPGENETPLGENEVDSQSQEQIPLEEQLVEAVSENVEPINWEPLEWVPDEYVPTDVPDVYLLLDEDGVPLGYFTPMLREGGDPSNPDDYDWIEVTEDGIPLGAFDVPKENPKTSDHTTSVSYYLLIVCALIGTCILLLRKRFILNTKHRK